MKNHIAFKFLAILLCALALFGSVASTGAIVALTGAGLYDKTVQQVRDAEVKSWGRDLTSGVSMYYSSIELGGCPEALVAEHVHSGSWYYSGFNWEKAGYALKDAEGNVLETGGTLTESDGGAVYTFPVSGQYLYLVSTEPKAELFEVPTQSVEAKIYSDEATYIYNAIPKTGAAVYGARFWDMNGQPLYNNTGNGEILGTVMYDEDGNVLYRSSSAEYVEVGQISQLELLGMTSEVIYEAYASQGVGELTQDELGCIIFTASVRPEQFQELTAEEAVTEATEATNPPETQPVTEAATQPTAEETQAPEVDENGNPVQASTEETAEQEQTQSQEQSEETAEESAENADQEETAPPTEPQEAEVSEDPEAVVETTAETAPTETAAAETAPTETQTPTVPEETIPQQTVPDPTAPVTINGKPLEQYDISRYEYINEQSGSTMVAKCVYVPMPEMTLELYLVQGGLRDDGFFALLEVVRGFRSDLFLILGVSLLVFAILGVYLCCAAGRTPGSKRVQAGGLNRMPLDVYLILAIAGISGIIVVVWEGASVALEQNLQVGCAFGAGAGYLACLIFVGLCFAFVAQIKTPNGFWWHNTLCVRVLCLLGLAGQWVLRRLLPFLGRELKKLGSSVGSLLSKLMGHLKEKTHTFLSLLPLTWQWLACGFGIFLLMLLAMAFRSVFFTLLFLAADIVLILYGARSFGTLMESTRRMSRGDLNIKVDDKQMVGVFRDFAEDLNDLAGVAVAAAQKQLKSERMKTELITNVSHDIKTPLTSIINYVDLLQRPHTQQEEAAYLEVLDRQSQRLKKLIEDLMEMSKANTGNMTVEITEVNAVESVNQALGEFADKLDRAQLIPVFRHTEEAVFMRADGRLVWRVLSNLLGNAVKYAMPGTRLYVDLLETEGKVILSLKNISREELNVDADELMERFVRGDGSRNTEGSGLGLNIAKSLMELQKGQLQLLVDGDLFKVTLIFPSV